MRGWVWTAEVRAVFGERRAVFGRWGGRGFWPASCGSSADGEDGEGAFQVVGDGGEMDLDGGLSEAAPIDGDPAGRRNLATAHALPTPPRQSVMMME